MSHRAEQIVEQIQSLLRTFPAFAVNPENVQIHRTLSLSEDASELDAVIINIGEDVPVSDLGTDNLGFIDSLLTVAITAYCKGADEPTVRLALMNLRAQIHQALMANDTIGLAFVIATRYGGAAAPELDASGDETVGVLENRWHFHYRMNFSDPG